MVSNLIKLAIQNIYRNIVILYNVYKNTKKSKMTNKKMVIYIMKNSLKNLDGTIIYFMLHII
jgi:hypothetical protein